MTDISRLPGPQSDLWEWQLHGACRGKDTELFFHPEGERGPRRANREASAKAVCATCPVLLQCRDARPRRPRAVRRLGRAVRARARGDHPRPGPAGWPAAGRRGPLTAGHAARASDVPPGRDDLATRPSGVRPAPPEVVVPVHLPLDRAAVAAALVPCCVLAAALVLTGCTAGGPRHAASGQRPAGHVQRPARPSTSPVAAATRGRRAPHRRRPPRRSPRSSERQDADVLVVAPHAARRRRPRAADRAVATRRARCSLSAGTVARRPAGRSRRSASTRRRSAPSPPRAPPSPTRSGRPSPRGEAVVSHEVAEAAGPAPRHRRAARPAVRRSADVRLGALATTGLPRADLVLDDERGARPRAAAGQRPAAHRARGHRPRRLRRRRARASPAAPPSTCCRCRPPVARLTGGEAAEDLGAFSYRYFADGTIEPDARWVRDNIRTEQVPVMGRVTCHRLMLPQLRGALQEVAGRRPRRDAARPTTAATSRASSSATPTGSISLHTWGIAIDMDAATNYRGIRGTMDRRVVEIFKRWGFAWGGDWQYTDPMHFELATILTQPRA